MRNLRPHSLADLCASAIAFVALSLVVIPSISRLWDTRNYFSSAVEPLKQNQFGATAGGPVRKDQLFAFGYYEGFRNRQGVTTSSVVPTAAQQKGDFSGIGHPLINFAAGGVPFPNNQIPPGRINPVGAKVAALYPNGNVSPSVYTRPL